MPGRSPSEAVRRFVAPILDALSCFATGKVTADTYDPSLEGVLTLNRGELVQLDGPGKVRLSVQMRYLIVASDSNGRWKVTTRGWIHRLCDRNGERFAGYHWHPISDPDFAEGNPIGSSTA